MPRWTISTRPPSRCTSRYLPAARTLHCPGPSAPAPSRGSGLRRSPRRHRDMVMRRPVRRAASPRRTVSTRAIPASCGHGSAGSAAGLWSAAMASARGEHDATDGADFGFRRVGEDEKPGLVRDLFDRVAGRYDLMNDLMKAAASIACGSARWWPGSRPAPAWPCSTWPAAPATSRAGSGRAMEGEGRVIVAMRAERMVDEGRERHLERRAHRRHRVAGGRCRGAAVAGTFGGCLYDRLRHPAT